MTPQLGGSSDVSGSTERENAGQPEGVAGSSGDVVAAPASAGTRILPFIRDLNPMRDDLPGLIAVIREHAGDRDDLVEAVYNKWKADKKRTGFTKRSIGANTLSSLGPENLQIIDESCQLTELGRSLYRDRNELAKFRQTLAVHILKNRGGWQFVRALCVLGERGRRPTREEVAGFLAEKYGIEEWRDMNNLSSLHGFLSWCGVVSNYEVDEPLVERWLGASVTQVGEFERLPLESREYFRGLVGVGGSGTAFQVRSATEALLRRPLDPHQVPSRMKPLLDLGYVQHDGRRGQRTGVYSVPEQKLGEALASIAGDLTVVGSVPDEVFQHDIAWTVSRLFDEELSKDEKGRTLEVTAAMICWRLGLRRLQIRERKPQEIDVTAEYLGVGFQEWSAQCKAYGRGSVRSVDVLREFGLAILHRYSVLLFVTTSGYTPDARHTADEISRSSSIQVILLDGANLREIASRPDALYSIVKERSQAIRRLRKESEVATPFIDQPSANPSGLEFLPRGDEGS